MEFKLWSELNKEASQHLKPDFGFRTWEELSESDKRKMWKNLEFKYFFDTKIKADYSNTYANEKGFYYDFHGEGYEQDLTRKRIGSTIWTLNDLYKAKSYARNFLESRTYTEACTDFYKIFIDEGEDVVFELLSIYAKHFIDEGEISANRLTKNDKESTSAFKKREEEKIWETFDGFADDLNEVFSHFGISHYLTRLGFAPKQEEKIHQLVYEPVLKLLSNEKWKEVNQHLSDAFAEYRKNTPNGYSTCITHTVSAIQAFLQILILGKTGSGEISKLLVQGQKESLIPPDMFTKEMFKTIESVLMRERQEKGDAHPKKEYASERNARLILNLAMVFIQHCIIP